MFTRKGEELKKLQDMLSSENGIYNAGTIISPSSGKLVLSLFCPVFDYDGKTIIGYVGTLSFIFIRISTRPLKYIESSILNLKELKLQKEHKLDKYINCKSETGQIATAINSLYDSFKDIVLRLNDCSDSLTQSAVKMSDSSGVLIQCVEENSYTTEQFTQHAESITDAIKRVDDEIASRFSEY